MRDGAVTSLDEATKERYIPFSIDRYRALPLAILRQTGPNIAGKTLTCSVAYHVHKVNSVGH
ncbi:hypothetical protein, partial [Sphingomonas sanguinis]|uniref:hypothetical protein n=1 Tax=Sphingomonas sanguinis TaxID=33051 RepID=UPI0019D40BCB